MMSFIRWTMRHVFSVMVIASALCLLPCESASAVNRRVDASASTTGPGTAPDWSNCYNSLQSALLAADNGDQIWVAGATGSGYTYKPHASTTTVSFVIDKRLLVKGGWPGLANPSATEPDPDTYISILSGDLGTADTFSASTTTWHTFGNMSDNSLVIVKFQNPSAGDALNKDNCWLQGFTVRGANGNAIHCISGSPQIRECIITRNSITGNGAGMLTNSGTHPMIRNCEFVQNQATGNGGGIYTNAPIIVLNTVFDQNRANNGAGVHALGTGTDDYYSCEFKHNIALESTGGGITAKGGGDALTRIINCVMHHNVTTDAGGAVYVKNGDLDIINSTIADNIANELSGGGVNADNCYIRNSIIWGNEPDQVDASAHNVQHSDIEDWAGAGSNGNIDADPKFESPSSGNYRLQCGTPPSPAINKGNDAAMECDEFDVDLNSINCSGLPQPAPDRDLNARKNGAHVDMGAYERLIPPCPKDIAPPGGDLEVSTPDLLAVITAWGPCPGSCPPSCVADFSGDCQVSTPDLLAILNAWGMCQCIEEPPGGVDLIPEEVSDCMEICEEDPDYGGCVTKCLCAIGYYNEECD